MQNYSILYVVGFTLLLCIATKYFNKKIMPTVCEAIAIPIISAIGVFLLQGFVTLFLNNNIISINIGAIETVIRNVDLYTILINGVLPFILATTASQFKVSNLKMYFAQISLLASLALVLCALSFASLMYVFNYSIGFEIPFLILLLLGCALSPTDPIGIKGVLSSVKAPDHLLIKLEGESLANDAVAILSFMTILALIKGSDVNVMTISYTLIYEIILAIVIGVIFGKIGVSMMKFDKSNIQTLIMIIAFVACTSYLLALCLHASAPITAVACGLIIGNEWHKFVDENKIEKVNDFWHTNEGIINSLIFTIIGLELFIIEKDKMLFIGGVVAFFVLHISRFIATFVSFALFPNLWKKSLNGSLTILSWGGVRGAISLALILAVLNIPEIKPYASFVFGYTFVTVLLSGVVCGLGLPYIINAFYHNETPKQGIIHDFLQKCANTLNRKKFKYEIIDDGNKQTIQVYNAEHNGIKQDSDQF